MIRTRKKDPAAEAPGEHEAAGQDGAQGGDDSAVPEPPEALTDDATASELAAAAEAFRQRASAARGRAEQARAQAQQVTADAQAEAERITKAARNEASRLQWTVARDAEHEAGQDDGRAAPIEEAIRRKAQGAEAVQRGLALAGEYENAASRVEDLDGRLAELAGGRQALEGQLAAAREAADVDSIASLRARIAAIEEACAALNGKRDTARARLEAIGTGEQRGELYDALSAARRHAAVAREMIHQAFPDTPEAVADRQQAEFRAIFQANAERIADERRAARQPQRPNIVRL